MTTVNGLGLFLASADMVRDPARTAELALSCAASWVAVLVESVDGRRQKVARVQRVVDALRAQDIDPVLYTFPTASRIQQAAEYLLTCAAAANVRKGCLDLEPYKKEDWTEESIGELVHATASLKPSITLFTRPQWNDIDWAKVAPDAEIWLQVYERARDEARLRAAIARWPLRRVVPLFGTYLGDIARLEDDLGNVAPWAKAVGAAGVWAGATTDAGEAHVLAEWTLATL